ncbi:GNAT family N-acetyltransferase [Lutimaribacter saemankumensis]|uniref:Predicted N-acetyltransferase YhbS n=1 Tax=Lutimaribacter saemankumensis TaxID=490829 RepID=A0A1G8QX06_9RHOB|nr:N-acetyltransferase [Lutimaribacter saemankumensis]SDJ09143.1 Predicted N-acetyltransferase YhbS [Lutimaribacter saemankumensis]
MEFTTTYAHRNREITDLFRSTFTDSEGAEEGELIGALVARMLATVDAADIFVFCAIDAGTLAGAAVFTRMTYSEDERVVFILSPMAVATAYQGKGIGQELLAFGLTELRDNGVDVALTYGDINFYSRVGFRQIPEAVAPPPLPLTYPEGWLGQSLTNRQLAPLRGLSGCVAALNDPALW